MARLFKRKLIIGKYLISDCYISKIEITSDIPNPITIDIEIIDTDIGNKYSKSFTTFNNINDCNIEEFLKTCNLQENK